MHKKYLYIIYICIIAFASIYIYLLSRKHYISLTNNSDYTVAINPENHPSYGGLKFSNGPQNGTSVVLSTLRRGGGAKLINQLLGSDNEHLFINNVSDIHIMHPLARYRLDLIHHDGLTDLTFHDGGLEKAKFDNIYFYPLYAENRLIAGMQVIVDMHGAALDNCVVARNLMDIALLNGLSFISNDKNIEPGLYEARYLRIDDYDFGIWAIWLNSYKHDDDDLIYLLGPTQGKYLTDIKVNKFYSVREFTTLLQELLTQKALTIQSQISN